MPYMEETDQYYFDPFKQETGETFARDGSNYDSSVPRPKLSDAFRTLNRHFKPGQLFQVTIVGKLYKGKSKVTGMSFTTDFSSIEFVSTGSGLTGKAVTHGG